MRPTRLRFGRGVTPAAGSDIDVINIRTVSACPVLGQLLHDATILNALWLRPTDVCAWRLTFFVKDDRQYTGRVFQGLNQGVHEYSNSVWDM